MLTTNLANNQYVIQNNGGIIFRSYNTNIVLLPAEGGAIFNENAFNYSRTTTKYLRRFMAAWGIDENDAKKAIKEGGTVEGIRATTPETADNWSL